MRVERAVLCVVVAVAWAGAPSPAAAGGFEIPAVGTRPAGRAGAFVARADDPLATWYNPAALSALEGVQVSLNLHMPWWHSCYQRSGTYGAFLDDPRLPDDPTAADLPDVSRFGDLGPGSGEGYGDEPFPEVCNQDGFGLAPTLLASFRVHERVGLGLGVIAPAGSGDNVWGSADGVVEGVNGEQRPAPNRYMQTFTDAQLVRLALGMGVQVTDWLRLGGTFLWGLSFADSAAYTAFQGSERAAQDLRVDLENMRDVFIPGVVASAHVDPVDALQMAVTFQYSDDIRAEGDGTVTFGDFAVDQSGALPDGATVPSTVGPVPFGLRVPQQMVLRFGVRYRLLRAGTGMKRVYEGDIDPMEDEVFDIELDVAWERNSRIDAFTVTSPTRPGDTCADRPELCFEREIVGDGADPVSVPITPETLQQKGFKDQITLHLGSDWNVVPGTFALRAGVSFESNGYDESLAQIDFQPGRRVGAHAGLTLRFGGFELSVAYAHIFQWDLVADPIGSGTDDEAALEQAVRVPPGAVVNAGRYENGWDLFSVGLAYRFGD